MKESVRGHHLPSGDNYAALIFNWVGRVSEWCDLWGMKLNASKTKTMIGGTVLKESDDLVILGVTFD